MNVYPANAIEACAMSSPQKEPYALIEDLYNRFISFQVDFRSPDIEITGSWNSPVETDSIIPGNTNAANGRIRLYNGNNLLHDSCFDTDGYLTIANTEKLNVTSFILNLSGSENISLGYLFIGAKLELPRFAVQPAKGLELRNEDGRTFTGQVMGIPIETLKTFSASYLRIPNDQKKIFDGYTEGVQTVIPHVIDPYPEAHEQFEPFYATLKSYGDAVKREENNFYWDFQCDWMEAK
jgi:hypothetical protein